MNASTIALTGYVAWFLFLLLAIGGTRAALVLAGQRAANSFRPDGSDMPSVATRLTRAHANSYTAAHK